LSPWTLVEGFDAFCSQAEDLTLEWTVGNPCVIGWTSASELLHPKMRIGIDEGATIAGAGVIETHVETVGVEENGVSCLGNYDNCILAGVDVARMGTFDLSRKPMGAGKEGEAALIGGEVFEVEVDLHVEVEAMAEIDAESVSHITMPGSGETLTRREEAGAGLNELNILTDG